MKRSPVKPLAIVLTSMIAVGAQAADLKDVANAAWSYDGTWQAARQTWEANQQVLVQGRAALLPTIDASYSVDKVQQTYESIGNLHVDNRQRTTSVTLTQPLFRLDAFYGYKQAKATVSIDQANFYQARQDFVLRVANAYFGVLRAWDDLVAARAEEKAIGRQYDQTQERFKVGLVPNTDVEAAKASHDNTKVNLIVAKQNFGIARDKLEALTGRKWSHLEELRKDLPMGNPAPEKIQAWINKATYQNPTLLAARYTAKAADLNSKVQLGAMFPKIQLVGQYQHIHNTTPSVSGGTPGNSFAQFYSRAPDTNTNTIGIQITMPLFHGGSLNSQRKQAALQANAAEDTLQQTLRDVTQQTRSAYRTVESDSLSVRARQQAIKSARTSLQATRSGYQVGTRNIVDVLNAEQALYSALRDYSNARYSYIIDSLTLKSDAGELDIQDLVDVNKWLSDTDTLNLYNPDLDAKSDAMMPKDD